MYLIGLFVCCDEKKEVLTVMFVFESVTIKFP